MKIRVKELLPGFLIKPYETSSQSYVFIAAVPHPIYEGFQLVIWRETAGFFKYHFDCLSPDMEIDGYIEQTQEELAKNIRLALGIGIV